MSSISNIEVVNQRNSVTAFNFQNFMFAITVEGGPLDCGWRCVTPIKSNVPPLVTDNKSTSSASACQISDVRWSEYRGENRETEDQRAYLLRTRGVDVCLEPA